jgi:Restriction endonuclease
MSIDELVTDWGGFERLVVELHETGEVTVQHNVTLTGRSGTPRQIDVLIRYKQGLYEHLIIAECKYWNSSVRREDVDALAMTVRLPGWSVVATVRAQKQYVDWYVLDPRKLAAARSAGFLVERNL